MPETFMDKRRQTLRELIALYGGNTGPDEVQKYLDMWLKGRLTQKEIEMIIAHEHGATSGELAEQFGYSSGERARGGLTRARRKIDNERRGTHGDE